MPISLLELLGGLNGDDVHESAGVALNHVEAIARLHYSAFVDYTRAVSRLGRFVWPGFH